MNKTTVMPDTVLINRRAAECKNEKYVSGDAKVSVKRDGGMLRIDVTASVTPLREAVLVFKDRIRGEGETLSDTWERAYGDLFFSKAKNRKVMPWYFVRKTGSGLQLYGVKTGAASMCSWEIREGDVLLHLDLRNGTQGVCLDGREFTAAEALMCESVAGTPEDMFWEIHSFLRLLCSNCIYDGKPIYGANNWYYAYGKSSRDEVLADARYLAELTNGLKNRPFIVIDDGWQQDHMGDYNGGPWNSGNADYGDMGAIASEMKKAGVLPGIWFRPLYDRTGIPEELKFERDKNVFDISLPESLEHVANDVRRIRDWGYELLKYDFSCVDIFGRWGVHMGRSLTSNTGWAFKDRSRTTAEIITDFYRTIYENAGNMLILGCNCVSHLAAGYVHANRTGDDTSGVEWERTKKYGVNTLAFRTVQHGAFYAADADCVGITDRIDWKKNRQWMEIMSLSSTPFFVSVRPGTLTRAQEKELRSAYKAASENTVTAIPLDAEHSKTPEKWLTAAGEKRYRW
jgi:alpha-galactosidase